MITRELAKSDWQDFFDILTRTYIGKDIFLEVVGMDIGDQPQGVPINLIGLSYDPKGDTFFVHSGSVKHLVPSPRQIFVKEDRGFLWSIEVIDRENHRHIVQLREPVKLKSAS